MRDNDEAANDNDVVEGNAQAVSFKITAKDFGKFDGSPEHWFAFKNKTQSTLGIAGFSALLDERIPIRDIEGNWRLYYLFEGATNEGSASHIVKRHKELRDGRAAWQSLVEWYEGRVVAGDIAKTCRVKLQALELNPKGDTNSYINEFIRLKDQLEDTGEGERPATLIDQFLDQIKDSKYDVTVTTLRMDPNKTLESCIQAIRRHDLVIARQKVQDHRLTKVRRLNIEDDVSIQSMASSYIQPEAWYALTPDQRKAIIQARQENPTSNPTNNPSANGQGELAKKEAKRVRRAKVKEAKKKAWMEAKKRAGKPEGEKD